MTRLVFPLAFIFALITLVAIVQSLGNSETVAVADKKPINNSTIKQFAILPFVAPALNVKDAEGKDFPSEKINNGVTIVTFWSSVCGECDTGLPVLDKFANEHPEINMVLVNYKDDIEVGKEKLSLLDIKLKSYFDQNGSAFKEWEATMPSSYYIRDGLIQYFFPGRVSLEHLQALLAL